MNGTTTLISLLVGTTAEPVGGSTSHTDGSTGSTGGSMGMSLGGPEYLANHPISAYIYLFIMGSAAILGTIGNLFVLGSVRLNKHLRNSRNVFLVNLAIADLCVTVIADPFGCIGMTEGKTFFDPRGWLCDLVATICLTACVCALFSIGGISFNRYVNICYPNVYPKVFSLWKNIIMCVCFWMVGLAMSLPGLLGWTDNVYDHKMMECIWNRLHNLSYTIFFSLGVVLSPTLVISFSYIMIYRHVRASKRKIEALDSKDAISNAKKRDGAVKLARTLFIIFMIFVGCWAPYAVLVLIDWNDNFPHEVHLFILMLAHMHSTLNPFVYWITNVHFRQGYMMVLQRLCCCQSAKKLIPLGQSITGQSFQQTDQPTKITVATKNGSA